MENELLYSGGKVSYKDYIGALRKYHITMQVPVLNSEGTRSQRRASFSREEYDKALPKSFIWSKTVVQRKQGRSESC
jgi:hypothetical protein